MFNNKGLQKIIVISLMTGTLTFFPNFVGIFNTHTAHAFSVTSGIKGIFNEATNKTKAANAAFDYFDVGMNYFNAKDYRTAIVYFTKSIELKPNLASFYSMRGLCYMKLEEYNQAIVEYTIAIQIDPSWGNYSARAYIYDKMKEYSKAIDDYTKIIPYQPHYAPYYYSRGCDYYELQDYKPAIEDFTKAIQLGIEDFKAGKAYEKRGKCYEALSEMDKAKADLDRANILLNDENLIKADEYYELSWEYRREKDYNKSIECLTKSIELKSNNDAAYLMRAISYYDLKMYQNAIDDYMKAIELRPDDDNIDTTYNMIGYCYDKLKNKKMAKMYHKKAKELKKQKK